MGLDCNAIGVGEVLPTVAEEIAAGALFAVTVGVGLGRGLSPGLGRTSESGLETAVRNATVQTTAPTVANFATGGSPNSTIAGSVARNDCAVAGATRFDSALCV